jgi:peptidoglycan/LPS O-acetylase OafA/YrhL
MKRLDQLTSLLCGAGGAGLASVAAGRGGEPAATAGPHAVHEGYAGVSFFFMLSGYILAHTYQGKLAGGAIRAGIIWRCGWRASCRCTGWWGCRWRSGRWRSGAAMLPKVAVNLALLQAWVPDPDWYFTVNEPSWSLSDEAFFYLLRLSGLLARAAAGVAGGRCWR